MQLSPLNMAAFRFRLSPVGLLVILSSILLLASSVLAAPSPSPAKLVARKDKYPSKEDCESHLKKDEPAKDTSIFFTGLAKKAMNEVKTYAVDHGLTHVTNVYTPKQFTNVGEYEGTDEERRAFQEAFSAVYAEHTSGKAYLMMDLEKKPKKDSIFYSVEFPALRDGGDVSEIIWLDINNKPDDPTKETKTWWKKGDDDPPADDAAVGPEEDRIGEEDAPSPEPEPLRPECKDTDTLSRLPFNVFSGSAGNIYDDFCPAVEGDLKAELTWTVNSDGTRKESKRKRTPPPNPNTYVDWKFELTWSPNGDASGCKSSCADAYASIANSLCGHLGGECSPLKFP